MYGVGEVLCNTKDSYPEYIKNRNPEGRSITWWHVAKEGSQIVNEYL
jgi:hypothetical protein